MEQFNGKKKDEADVYLSAAGEIARRSTCMRSKCGSVIVQNGKVIGKGYNSPPGNIEEQRRCKCDKAEYHRKVTDKTCCVHAEQRAILDAVKNYPEEIPGSVLYFVRLGDPGHVSGRPYCTICSKMCLDVGIRLFILRQKEGICAYTAEEYNRLSYQYTD